MAGDLYRRFCDWCSMSVDWVVSSIKFGKKLKEKWFEKIRSDVWRHERELVALRLDSRIRL